MVEGIVLSKLARTALAIHELAECAHAADPVPVCITVAADPDAEIYDARSSTHRTHRGFWLGNPGL